MNNSSILLLISLIVAISSIAWASRKHGMVVFSPYSISSRSGSGYHIDKTKIEDFLRKLLIAGVMSVIVGLLISGNITLALEFTLLNLFFLGYGLAWDNLLTKNSVKKLNQSGDDEE